MQLGLGLGLDGRKNRGDVYGIPGDRGKEALIILFDVPPLSPSSLHICKVRSVRRVVYFEFYFASLKALTNKLK